VRPPLAVAFALLVSSLRDDTPLRLPPLPTFEGRAIALSAEQTAALARGEPAVQLLETKDGRVTAVFGIVAIKGTRKAFVARLTSFAQSVRSPDLRSFGLFKTPATPASVGTFTVSANDVSSLRKCRAGKCEFKLPAAEMARAKAILDSGAAGPAKLATYAQRRAAQYVNAYRERGNAAMVAYDDYGKGSVRASDAFAALLAASPYLAQNAPTLQQYVQQYPRNRPAGASDIIYWSVEAMKGLRPTLTINQLVVFSPPNRPNMTVAVTKQLFADHYFEGMLDERIAVDRADAPSGGGFYLMVLRQYRFDNLPGGVLDIRGRARSALHDRVVAELRRMQKQ
jgi:hypothetical protein